MAEEFDPLDRDEAPDGVTLLEDGGALVEDPEAEDGEESDKGEFGENLAETLPIAKLNLIASKLLDLIELDKDARAERDKQQEEGIRRTGLGNDAPGGADFDGASSVVHPVLAEGCVDFSARAIKELFPAQGPVRTKVYGVTDEAKLEKAGKKRDFLNFYLTERMTEYKAEKEILFTQLPLGGSQYEKYWFDGKRVRMEFVPIDKVLLPYSANSFYTSPRLTHVRELTSDLLDEYVDEGFYRDIFGGAPGDVEKSASQEATEKVEGKDDTGFNEDGTRTIFEVSTMLELTEEEEKSPYIVHIDESTGKIAAIYRNWRESDEEKTPLDWWVEDKFIPWRGAYGIGFPHLIGGLSASLTGALRALLDSAHINNTPAAVKLKGGRASGQNVNIDVTGVTEMEAPAGIDDIRKVMMPMPFNPPSQVLFQLMEWLTQQAKGVVATAEERIADTSDRMPVGTALALIEQGSQVFSSIHSRLHDSQHRALRIICRLIATYPEHALADMARFGLVPEDFLESDDVAPVSDPNIFSETQRFAQMQSVMQLQSGDAQDPSIPWNKLAIRRRMLTLLRVDNVDELLPKPPKPVTADPVTENVLVVQGAQLKASPFQDHQAHIKAHLMFIMHPMIAASQGLGPQLSGLLGHIQEHMILDYQHVAESALQAVLATTEGLSPDQAALMAAMKAQEATSQMDQAILPLIQEASKLVQSKMPPPPVDPAIQKTFEASMAEIQRKAQADAARLAFDEKKLMAEGQFEQIRLQLSEQSSQMEAMLKRELAMIAEQGKQQIAQLQQHIEVLKNEADNTQHQQTEVIKNLQDNQTKLEIALQTAQQTPPPPPPEAPDFTPQLEALNKALAQVEKSRSQDALTAVMQGLQAVISQMNKPKHTKLEFDAKGKPIGMTQQ